LDIVQFIDFELNKPCPPPRIMSEEEKKVRANGLKQAMTDFFEGIQRNPIKNDDSFH